MPTRLVRISKELDDELNRRIAMMRDRDIFKTKVDISREVAFQLKVNKNSKDNNDYRTDYTHWVHYRKRR